MARSIKDIYNQIIEQKESFSELDVYLPDYNVSEDVDANPFMALLQDLNSSSKVAIWRLWAFIVAVALHFHERIFDNHIVEVEAIAAKSIVGKINWYADQASKFQYGYALTFDNNTYKYFYVDSTSQEAIDSRIISKRSAKEIFSSNFSGIRIKVAKLSGGVLVKLTEDEKQAFSFYMSRIGFAGVAIDVVSEDADEIKYHLRVFFDGVIPENDVLIEVEQAFNDYLSAIDFDGVFYITKLIDRLQKITSVRDVVPIRISSRPSGASSWIDINRKHEPVSGYYVAAALGEGIDFSKIELIAE